MQHKNKTQDEYNEKWLEKLDADNKIPQEFLTDMILQSIKIIMEHNYLQFRDTEWVQLTRIAMGTPMECIYATMYYAWKEMTEILPLYNSNLLSFYDKFNTFLEYRNQTQKQTAHLKTWLEKWRTKDQTS